ncbi:MAG: glycosyltransferase family 39 protein [Oscillatoriaceae bacterium SKW80]|nr:glycosyltransferase family 39 protein [Oscillatoriaceae bacterium SKYG93]MCX8121908.1 glycosyltransferase family 39 protein [Oscillatoriaceae bacterium SKW80]MDW8454669.1 glycosyltransferase family 39 protein [Oscillatoriaceae cyanobacterium SKYGB_i_bin93]HIK28626.1 glycosyltransferase family 39 protein [Oscillatoriaceae cyanobacterium M7585_C2015_266]
MRFSKHYMVLALALLVGASLRLALLDFKPLWLDEVLTALFSQGRSYDDIPLDVVFSLNQLQQIFALNPQANCSQIAKVLLTQSTHPPVFFCLMNWWLHWINLPFSLAWKMRSLSVLFGILAIAAVYLLARLAFSKVVGVWAAFFMAVSPFGVYLSQEARHYSLPILVCALALSALVQIQKDFYRCTNQRPLIWIGWIAANTLGLYIHYFFILAFIAQLATLIFDFNFSLSRYSHWWKLHPRLFKYLPPWQYNILYIFICQYSKYIIISLVPLAFFIPWLPLLFAHFGRAETNWIPHPENIAPFYQTIAAWMTFSVMLPVEKQPTWIIIFSVTIGILFFIWLGWRAFLGLQLLWNQPVTHLGVRVLLSFTLWVLLQFVVIIYLLGKDLTVAPRYHFIYYPAICVLLAAGLQVRNVKKYKSGNKFLNFLLAPKPQEIFYTFLVAGFISSLVVISDLGYKKPFSPRLAAQNINVDSAVPKVIVVGYKNFQDVGLGLSVALELQKSEKEGKAGSYMVFLSRSQGYEQVWQNLSKLENLPAPPLNLWIVAPEIKRTDYPKQLFHKVTTCNIDTAHYHRIGVSYQLYRCIKKQKE